MRERVWWVPTASAPPAGQTTEATAAELGWTVEKLMGHVERGELPAPDVFNGRLVWPLGYALRVRCDVLHLPGTYGGVQGVWSETKRRARRKGKRKVGGRKHGHQGAGHQGGAKGGAA